MYSPTARLLTVLELLQSYKQMKGSEIARRLEVDLRTVRRYIVTLQDMGIPVEAERGPYGAYQLQRGYKLPPLMFTDGEAIALTLGLLAIRELHFPVDVASVEGALAKTERVMPEKLLYQARGLQESITFNVSSPPIQPQADFVTLLSLAVRQQQQVHLRYAAWNGDESEREFDPYGIVFNEGYWYTSGYCHLRQDLRTFRLDRVTGLEVNSNTFERPQDFDALDHVMKSLGSIPGASGQIIIRMDTTLEQAQQSISGILGTVEESEDGIIYRRGSHQIEWVAHWLLTLDFPVHIIQPVELRHIIQQFATKAQQMLNK
jgi:predicted DNA-binding transcriptional regulator YafY